LKRLNIEVMADNTMHLYESIEMTKKQGRTSKTKDMKKRHYFLLNPYEGCAFTRCPKCNNKTKVRKFSLVIHIDPRQMLLLNKQCKYCPSCDLIIVKEEGLKQLMVASIDQVRPAIVGNDYLVMGTVERKDWRESNQKQMEPTEIIKRMYVFKDVWNLKVTLAESDVK
jgi:hypothetical protein